MSEGQGPSWNDRVKIARARIDNALHNTRMAADRTVNEAKYRMIVSKEQHSKAVTQGQVYASEAMAFLADNLTSKLKPLQPTRDQVAIFQLLMNSIDEGTLQMESVKENVRVDGEPFVVLEYRYNNKNEIENKNGAQFSDLFNAREVNLYVRYGVTENFAPGFAVLGRIGLAIPRSIDFYTFPEKVSDTQETARLMGVVNEVHGWTQTLGIFGKGERIIKNCEGAYKGEQVAMTDQYFLVETYDGEDTQQTYWLYGSNGEIHDKLSSSERVKLTQQARQTSRN